jgi:hypothetical protein
MRKANMDGKHVNRELNVSGSGPVQDVRGEGNGRRNL